MSFADTAICIASCAGLVALVTEPILRAEPAEPAPIVKPFSARMGCPDWREGLSRSVTVIATEDAHGVLMGVQCIRTMDQGIAKGAGA